MRHAIQIYWRFIGISIRSQLQHRASFLMLITAQFIATSLMIVEIVILFDRFKTIGHWTLAEVALLYGIVHMSFSISEGLGKAFDNFSIPLRNGEFDRLLLRPCSTFLQVMGKEVQLARIGNFLQGFLVFLWAVNHVHIIWTFGDIVLVILAVCGGIFFFSSIFVMSAALCFWTTESLEIMNILSYGGVQTGQYPFFIYNDWFRRFFTFIIPLACTAYLPLTTIFEGNWIGWLAPFACMAFFGVALLAWRTGVRRYSSVGS